MNELEYCWVDEIEYSLEMLQGRLKVVEYLMLGPDEGDEEESIIEYDPTGRLEFDNEESVQALVPTLVQTGNEVVECVRSQVPPLTSVERGAVQGALLDDTGSGDEDEEGAPDTEENHSRDDWVKGKDVPNVPSGRGKPRHSRTTKKERKQEMKRAVEAAEALQRADVAKEATEAGQHEDADAA